MQYRHIKCNSLLRKIEKKDQLFQGDYTVDPYQNCEFGCKYCDSSYSDTVYIKTNAEKVLDKELKETDKGTIIVGSVHDPYQPTEKEYKKTRKILKIIEKNDFSCHILTKSTLILRDLDILSAMKDCLVTISLISLKKSIFKLFEKDLPSPINRLKTVQKLSDQGIKTGVAVIPFLPYIIEDEINHLVKKATEYDSDYFLYKHLELKGDQKTFFINYLKNLDQDLAEKYRELYDTGYFPRKQYIHDVGNRFRKECNKYNINNTI